VEVIRLREYINNKTDELMSLGMILMDEKVKFQLNSDFRLLNHYIYVRNQVINSLV
jgi:hypothetical protein